LVIWFSYLTVSSGFAVWTVGVNPLFYALILPQIGSQVNW